MQNIDKHVLVIGSQRPWLETILLEANVSHITTMDYVDIKCDHEKITTIGPKELREGFLDGTMPKFDAIVSFSSLEHSGLGR